MGAVGGNAIFVGTRFRPRSSKKRERERGRIKGARLSQDILNILSGFGGSQFVLICSPVLAMRMI